MNPDDYLKMALDPGRLAVLGALARGPATVDELVGGSGRPRRLVLETVAALLQAGMAVREQDRYALDEQALRDVARALPGPPAPDPRVGFGMTAGEQEVLGRFFRGTRLTEVPVSRGKRRVVLERLALEFEPGVRYAEPDVNAILSRFHDDYATLRRHLVDEGFLDRADGRYWRSGGRVA